MPACQIHITGVVQGVGFRPFVFGLAERFSLMGWVRNTSAGVDIVVEGKPENLAEFVQCVRQDAPPLARIDTMDITNIEMHGYAKFDIFDSQAIPGAFQPVSPDFSICPDCLRELFDPEDRRYLYPFINCTNCGPRFTIIDDIPYDRPKTTMARFELCDSCASEYAQPRDRRFHAQPVACPDCGPQIWLEDLMGQGLNLASLDDELLTVRTSNRRSVAVILTAQQFLASGRILAIKGLGGFHLACDACNPESVAELRRRKLRVGKPFALMMPDLATIERYCFVSQEERALLLAQSRPIVILQKRPGTNISEDVAPGQQTLGVMLPYTPLHYLLVSHLPFQILDGMVEPAQVLVMTSGNLSEEPIAIDNDDAKRRLAGLADVFLFHDRTIRTRCDDSVVRSTGFKSATESDADIEQRVYPLRRSRGFAPYPVRLPWVLPPILATGPELKNTFCLTRDSYAFLSHHIGDMENYETFQSFENGIRHYEHLFRIRPEILACDLHPNYLATRYALERGEQDRLPVHQVQHHHAHIAACMAEHALPDEPVIGVAFDGTGFGSDGAIWGGEFLLANYRSFERCYHLEYVPLPGGDAAIRNPARIALAYLWYYGIDWDPALPSVSEFCSEDRMTLRMQLEHNINAPLTSSMGRLFDAVAALAGIRQRVSYEAQAAIEMESLCKLEEPRTYRIEVPDPGSKPVSLSLESLFSELVVDKLSGVSPGSIAGSFINVVSCLVRDVVMSMRIISKGSPVILSGGVWQNMALLRTTIRLLEEAGIHPIYIHRKVPPNDGGISLGQAVIAHHRTQY